MKKIKLSKIELLLYIIGILLFLTGLIFTILGVLGDHLPPENPIISYERKSSPFFLFRYFGIILFSCGAVVFVFALLFFGRSAEKRSEREERRKQRLELAEKIENSDNVTEEVKESDSEENIKDIESTPVPPNKEQDNKDSEIKK